MQKVLLISLFALLSILLAGCANQNTGMTQDKAVEYVTEDLKSNHPGADINIYLITPENDSWRIAAKVTHGAHSICPDLTIVVYDYPKFGFQPREQNNITGGCEVLSCKGIPDCSITLEEEAIIASYKMNDRSNVSEVYDYINAYGEGSIQVYATQYDVYFEPENNRTYTGVWVVDWTSTKADNSIRLIINQTGGTLISKFIGSSTPQ